MERKIDQSLENWMVKQRRKPLLLRGARQTGKTYCVRKLGKKFEHFVEINFEQEPRFGRLFTEDLHGESIIQNISALRQVPIFAGKTLLFFDEIQECPRAVLALRYLYEELPGLHVIGAGSLLEFEMKNLSVPVGRIEFLYVRPFTFNEYLCVSGRGMLKEAIDKAHFDQPPDSLIHEEALKSLREYLFLGGMPGVIASFLEGRSFSAAIEEQRSIVQTFRADFAKYAGRTDVERVEKVFDAIPSMVGEKMIFSNIDPDARAYQIQGSLDLLVMARIIVKVRNTTGAGIPLTAGASEKHFKCIFLDVGLMQRVLGVSYEEWQRYELLLDHHRGGVAEQFVGQELLHRTGAQEEPGLFYWHRISAGSQAEVDYLCEANGRAIPVEVKSSSAGHLRSMHQYLRSFPNVSGGIKCSTMQFGRTDKVFSIPLYAASRIAELAGTI